MVPSDDKRRLPANNQNLERGSLKIHEKYDHAIFVFKFWVKLHFF